MHPTVRAKILEICAGREFDSVLEIGATEGSALLLDSPFISADRRVGVDLNPWEHPELEVHATNAHKMDSLDSDTFDCILCNAVLEHDPEFWKTLSEVRRVAATGALVVVGVPGYSGRVERPSILELLGISSAASDLEGPDVASGERTEDTSKSPESNSGSPLGRLYNILPRRLQQKVADAYRYAKSRDSPVAKTYGIHESPGDYYRFSPQAVEEVFLRDCTDIRIYDILRPPRIVGAGEYRGG